MLLAPSVSSFFSTPRWNLPPRGWRNAWFGLEVNTDAFASVDQLDDNQAIIFMQAFTGGPLNNPQVIGPPPAGRHWVWVVEFDLIARFRAPSNPNVTQVEAAVEVEFYLIRGGVYNWIWTESQRIYADAMTPTVRSSGWIYQYDANAQYQQGDIYFLFVYAQGRYFDSGYQGGTWNTTAFQFLSLHYLI
jgi:hypothetical protein